MCAAHAAVDGNTLAIDIGCVVACKEGGHRSDFFRLARPLERRDMSDLGVNAARARIVEHFAGHLCFNKAREDRIDPHAGAREGIGRTLRQAVHRRFAGAV